MKQRLLLTILSLFLLNAAMFADEYTDNQGIVYSYDPSKGTAFVSDGQSASDAVVIPETINVDGKTYTVTSIGSSAFWGCTGLTSISIPNSVTSIGEWAFEDCTGLTSIEIPNSVTTIGDGVFYGCTGLPVIDNIKYADTYLVDVVDKNLSEYIIKEGTRYIGSFAFSDCTGLKSINIPNSVTNIESGTFFGCTGLTSVTVDKDNPVYDSRDNSNCIIETASNTLIVGCKRSAIPNSVTSIGYRAFDGCTGLTSITIPNSVTSIGERAFYGCTGLSSINIPKSVIDIGHSAFRGCTGLPVIDNIRYADTYLVDVVDENLSVYIIKEGTRYIGTFAFSDCTGLTSITIPNSVESIEASAFNGCTRLTYITIPNSVTSIGNYAFYKCTGLISITIGNSVTSIGYGAFVDCSRLTSVTIPNSVTSIGDNDIWDNAFVGCENLNDVYIDIVDFANDNICWNIAPNRHYLYLGEEIKNHFIIPNSATNIGDYAFYGCKKLTSIVIPNSVESIGDSAFFYCSSLRYINIPESVNRIGKNAFVGCDNLEFVSITDLTAWCKIEFATIYSNPLFYGWWFTMDDVGHIEDLVIPDSVKSIGWAAFIYCTSLKSVFIPNSVTNIGKYAFDDCYGLSSIVVDKANPNYDSRDNCNCIIETKSNTLLWGCKNSFIPNSVTSINNYAFELCKGLKSVAIPHSVTDIGYSAFYGCTALETVRYTTRKPFGIDEDDNVFSDETYEKATLVVAPGYKKEIRELDGWKKFINIVEAPAQDLNDDGDVNTADVTAVYSFIKDGTASGFDGEAADINGDGDVNTADVVAIYNYIMYGE